MASYNFVPDVSSTAVAPPAAPANVYQNPGTTNFVPPAQTAGQQQQSSGTNFSPTQLLPKATGLINQAGQSLGFGVGGPTSATVAGPVQAASANAGTLTTAPLSGVLGGAGIGGIVGAVNPLAGGSTAGNVGGMIGGAIGAAAGFGPVGQVVGGFIGSSIGGVFGGKKKPGVHASEFQTGVLPGNDFKGATGYGTKRADKSQADSVHSDFTTYLSDISSKYGLDFSGSAFRGGYNDLHQGGWFLAAKKDLSKGDPDTAPDAWGNYTFNPDSNDKYKTYAQVAGQMLASQGKLTPDMAQQLIKDTEDRMKSETLGNAGFGGVEPIINNPKPSTKESFSDFVTRYRSGDLDAGPVTSARTQTPTPPSILGGGQQKNYDGLSQANKPASDVRPEKYKPTEQEIKDNPLLAGVN